MMFYSWRPYPLKPVNLKTFHPPSHLLWALVGYKPLKDKTRYLLGGTSWEGLWQVTSVLKRSTPTPPFDVVWVGWCSGVPEDGWGQWTLASQVWTLLSSAFLAVTGQPFLSLIVLPGSQHVLAPLNKDLKTAGPLLPAVGRETRSTGREGASLIFLCPESAEVVGDHGRWQAGQA